MHQVLNEKIPYFSDDGLSCAESTLRYLIEHGYADLPLDTVRIMTGLHGNMGRCATAARSTAVWQPSVPTSDAGKWARI